VSATRVGVGALIAGPVGALLGGMAKKKVDQRELYLVIEASTWADLVEVDPDRGRHAREFAREFAQAINLAARSSETES
jgi:hypothetical protein